LGIAYQTGPGRYCRKIGAGKVSGYAGDGNDRHDYPDISHFVLHDVLHRVIVMSLM
jgi:hypothetical protein